MLGEHITDDAFDVVLTVDAYDAVPTIDAFDTLKPGLKSSATQDIDETESSDGSDKEPEAEERLGQIFRRAEPKLQPELDFPKKLRCSLSRSHVTVTQIIGYAAAGGEIGAVNSRRPKPGFLPYPRLEAQPVSLQELFIAGFKGQASAGKTYTQYIISRNDVR
ncbi:hypothetical protein Tcan_11883 [Toxocara canis]|uniref:Uncharacterized protein n=1 Tax=Toxocara canis TaxID=6265 RepID=A0A0B2VNU2_TOXCA|nr:hypothetical protein Tcan_11883 [Toxocara canis]